VASEPPENNAEATPNHPGESEAPAAQPDQGGAMGSGSAPWQRVTADAEYVEQAAEASRVSEGQAAAAPTEQSTTKFRPLGDPQGVNGQPARTAVNLGVGAPTASARATPSALRRPGRGPRRASLQIKRIDPWSALKLSLVLGLAMFLVWMVVVGVLYGVLQGMGVWSKLNGNYTDLIQGGDTSRGELINAGRVFGVAAVLGLINVVLFTALSTVAAFIYNVSSDLAGGIEVTLSERE